MKKVLQLIILLLTITVAGQNTYLHCGKLIDTKSGTVLTEENDCHFWGENYCC